MEIRNTGSSRPVDSIAIDSNKAVSDDSQFSGVLQAELQQYRDNDPNLKIQGLEDQLSYAKVDLLSLHDKTGSENQSKYHMDPKVDQIEESDQKSFFADKLFNKDSEAMKIWKSIDGIASKTAIFSNVIGGFMELMNLPEKAKEGVAKFVDLVTNFSFIPYGLDGMRKAIFENKNPYMLLGFAMELSMVWMSDLKNKYLIRGAATGTDQIWVATKHKLIEKDAQRFHNGKFNSWTDGLIETPKACYEMLKDIFKNPVQALATIDNEKGTSGYYALLSSLGSIASTIGYFLTRNEKIFGTMRDISGSLFDWEMLLDKKPKAKLSGFCFIAESVLDFTARFIEDNSTRLFVNMLSHASGRQALQLYKATNDDEEEQVQVKKDISQDKRQSGSIREYKLAA